MPAMQHVYLTAHGEFHSGHWVGERAQIGMRLVIVDSTNVPDKGTTFEPLANGDVAVDSGTHAGTNGTLTRTWKARLGPVGSTDNADAAWQADLGDDFWTFLNSVKQYEVSSFRWTHVKIAPILTDGKYGGPAAVYQFTSPLVGSSAGGLPPENAIACTFRAPIVGRRGRGRFYLPAFSSVSTVLDTDGTVKSSYRTTLAGYLTTLIGNLENGPGTPVYEPMLAVLSAGSSTAVRPAQVRVGSHWDVQRRRQHQVVEEYTSVDL